MKKTIPKLLLGGIAAVFLLLLVRFEESPKAGANPKNVEIKEHDDYTVHIYFHYGTGGPMSLSPERLISVANIKLTYSDCRLSRRPPKNRFRRLIEALNGNVTESPVNFNCKWAFIVINSSGETVIKCFTDGRCMNGVYNGRPVKFDDSLDRWARENFTNAFGLD